MAKSPGLLQLARSGTTKFYSVHEEPIQYYCHSCRKYRHRKYFSQEERDLRKSNSFHKCRCDSCIKNHRTL